MKRSKFNETQDAVDFALGGELIQGMRAFWQDGEKWEQLSSVSRRSLTQFMGSEPR